MSALTSGCLSIPAACCPTLALSVLALTTSNRSKALSIPVAEKLSISWGSSLVSFKLASPRLPPTESAPGPAGLKSFFFLLGVVFLGGVLASSSARRRAASALRASCSWRFASLSAFLSFLEPSSHLDASRRSCRYPCLYTGRTMTLEATHTLFATAESFFFASFSAFLARPDSFFAFPPRGGMAIRSGGDEKVDLG